MDCRQAANLIAARIDEELTADDAAVLEAHLAGCAACRAALEEAAIQDAQLVRAFAGGRADAAAIARRAGDEMGGPPPLRGSARGTASRFGFRPVAWAAAALAAGFVIAAILNRPANSPPEPTHVSVQDPHSSATTELVAAQLTLASGEVFACPSGDEAWKPVAPGAALAAGDKVRTADFAKCEITLPGGSRLRLNAATELQLAETEVQLAGGQIWSAVHADAAPLRIAAGQARVTTLAPSAQLDVARGGSAATVTVVEGSAKVNGEGRASTTVRGGELLRVDVISGGPAPPFMGCEPVTDSLKATRWLDDLLLLLPADDPELSARVDALLSRIVMERLDAAADTPPGPVERDVRARGDAWALPIARYASTRISQPAGTERNMRRAAARLLADLATPACIEDLIAMLGDNDGRVRFHAVVALSRLTGQTLGFPPDRCAAEPRDPAAQSAWRQWWTHNRTRHPIAVD